MNSTPRPEDLGVLPVRWILHFWRPDDGLQRGTVSRLCPRGTYSHVVAYTRQTLALLGTADRMLDAILYGATMVPMLLSPAPPAGFVQALLPLAPLPWLRAW